MSRTIIVVEGCADAVFLNDLIITLMPSSFDRFTKINDFKRGKSIKISDNPEIKIFIAGGCNHITKYKNKIHEFIDLGYEILVIQDADNPIKDPYSGGVYKRNLFLKEFKEENDLKFNSFLLPNDKDDGDLETILIAIVNNSNYEPFYNNYKEYSSNVKSFSNEKHSLELLENKYLIFNYFQVYHGVKKSNEKNRCYRTQYWNLSHNSLLPLKDFLSKELKL